MNQAIETKYIGPSNVKGARICASAEPGRRYYTWDHAFNGPKNHFLAAKRYAEEFGWHGEWHGGGTNGGFVFVNSGAENPTFHVDKEGE